MPRWAIVLFAVLLGGPLIVGMTRLFLASDEDIGLRVGTVEQVRDATVIYLASERVFVTWDGGRFNGLIAASPHLEHRLLYCRSAAVFQGDHGELFDTAGEYLAGPSPSAMDRVAVAVEDGSVFVDPAGRTPGGGRSEGGADPAGQLCRVPGPEDPPGFATGGES